jgi:hypothetical protein
MATKETRPIRRTVVIGVGGTGRDTLMRLRRLIIDKYGKLSEFPIVQFVHIDADKGASESSGLSTGKNYIGQEIIFTQAEKVVTAMNGNEVNDLAKGLEDRGPYAPPSPYEHIKSWFPPQLRSNLKAIENGASGVRPIGKVAYFHNFRKIKEAIKAAENRTLGHDLFMLEKNLIVKPGLNVFVVGSLCGGTGSGMCLDVGYTLRKLYLGKAIETFAYFVISPELFGDDTPKMNASTYAALKELNHYSSEFSKYEAVYNPQSQESVSEKRTPFDFTFLVSNQTKEGHKILEKGKLCNIIAHKIYLDFADEVSVILSGNRDNFTDLLQIKDQHPRPNIQSFMTFGLAKIYFPRERIINICLNIIKENIVKFWINGEGQNSDAIFLLNTFLLNWVPPKSDSDIFRHKLEMSALDKNITFSQTINNWYNGLLEEINQISKKKEDRQKIAERLPGEFYSQFRKIQPGETENKRGIWLTKIKDKEIQVIEDLKMDIKIYLTDLLDPKKSNFSVKTALDWLEAMRTWLTKQQRQLEENLHDLGYLHQPEDITKIVKNMTTIFEEIEVKTSWFFGINGKKTLLIKEESISKVKQVTKISKENFEYFLTKGSINIVKSLYDYVQLLIHQVSEFASVISNLQESFDKNIKEIRRLNNDEMNGESIFSEEDIEEYLAQLLRDVEKTDKKISLTIDIADKANLKKQFVEFVLQKNIIREIDLKKIIDITVDEEFSTQQVRHSKSVIEQFLHKHPLSDAKTRLQQILAESEPLLPLNLTAPLYVNDPKKDSKIVAYKNNNEREVEEFKSILTREIGLREDIIKPIQSNEEIIFVQEYAAFPIRIINNIERMRSQYDLEKKHPSIHLHTDNRDFIDPVPPDENTTKRLQTLFYTCLALNKIAKDSTPDGYTVTYEAEFGILNVFKLSPIWNEAIDAIIHNLKIRIALESIESDLIEDLKKDPYGQYTKYEELIKNFARTVDNLSKEDPNYSEKSSLLEKNLTSGENSLLNQILIDFQKICDEVKANAAQINSAKTFLPDKLKHDQSHVDITDHEEDVNSDNL